MKGELVNYFKLFSWRLRVFRVERGEEKKEKNDEETEFCGSFYSQRFVWEVQVCLQLQKKS